jgi:hypothetical protein
MFSQRPVYAFHHNRGYRSSTSESIHRDSLFLTVILQPSPPVNAIFAGIAILLAVCFLSDPSESHRDIQILQAVKDVSASYDALVDLFASFENFLSRLGIYTGVLPTPALTNVLVKIIVELLSTLALATKQVKQGRLSDS